VGDLRLHLLQHDFPRAPLPSQVAQAVWDQPPYWAFCWPGGRYLSEWLPACNLPGTVVDLGCGSGILSIALARAGRRVWAVDSDPEARLATASNAALNGVKFPIVKSLEEVEESIPLLVLADFLYDPANLHDMERLRRFAPSVLLADCRLRQTPPEFVALAQVTRRIVPDLDWGDEFDSVFVASTLPLAEVLRGLAPP
jgi:predicted nicotinamide N-methyase